MLSSTINIEDIKIKIPSNIIISGPSTSGKTTFLLKLLHEKDDMFTPKPRSVLYAYGQHGDHIEKLRNMTNITLFNGVPDEATIDNLPPHSVLIFDDLMLNITEQFLSHIFTRKSHHKKICTIFLCQNLFEKKVKVPRINSHYIVLLNSPAAQLSIRTLGTMLFPRNLDFFLQAYKSACSRKYGYLFIDLAPNSDPLLRLRTNIFKDDEKHIFLPIKNY